MSRSKENPTVLPINDAGEWDFEVVEKDFELLEQASKLGCYDPRYGTIDRKRMKEEGFITSDEARRRMLTKTREKPISVRNPENSPYLPKI